MKVGDLVRTISGAERRDELGVISSIIEPHEHNLWPGDNLIEVLYGDGFLRWNERSLEVVSDASR